MPDDLERHRVDLLRGGHLAVGVEVVILGADAHVAGGQDEVGLVDAVHHIHQAHVVGFELERIDVDLNLPITAAVRLRHRCAGHVRDLIAHLELREILELGFVEPSPLSVTRQTGWLDAVMPSTTGGSVPEGSRRRSAMARLEMLLSAELASVPGESRS